MWQWCVWLCHSQKLGVWITKSQYEILICELRMTTSCKNIKRHLAPCVGPPCHHDDAQPAEAKPRATAHGEEVECNVTATHTTFLMHSWLEYKGLHVYAVVGCIWWQGPNGGRIAMNAVIQARNLTTIIVNTLWRKILKGALMDCLDSILRRQQSGSWSVFLKKQLDACEKVEGTATLFGLIYAPFY